MSKRKVIVVEDSKIIRLGYKDTLERQGYSVETFDGAKAALSRIGFGWGGIIISDVIMPGMDGITMMKRIQEIDQDLPVILITGQGDVQSAVSAMKQGAFDYVLKRLAGQAQYFEDRAPWNEAYKKQGFNIPVANAVTLLVAVGDGGPMPPIGVNLPNQEAIGERYGNKSWTLRR